MSLPPPIVTAEWAAEHPVLFADVRWFLDGRSGRDEYVAGHLPGAVWVDLDAHLAAPPAGADGGRHPLPTPEAFADALGALGLVDHHVVAYDDADGMSAGRLVWMLRALGRPASLLDGGLRGWAGDLETGWVEPTATRAPAPEAWPADRLATIDDVIAISAGERPGVTLIDARGPARHRGDEEPVDARPGHIPGARNVPFAGGLDAVSAALVAAVAPGDDLVASCGSGVSACVDLLAAEQIGLGVGKLFVGSWSQWSARNDLPAASGDEPLPAQGPLDGPQCPCGYAIPGATFDEQVDAGLAHMVDAHPDVPAQRGALANVMAAGERTTGPIERLDVPGFPTIRPLTPADADAVVAFFDTDAFPDNAAWASCYCVFQLVGEPDQVDWINRPWQANRALLARSIRSGEITGVIAVTDEGRVVAWANVSRRDTLPYHASDDAAADETTGCTVCIVVAPPYRGHGFAPRLVWTADRVAAEQGWTTLEAYPIAGRSTYHGHPKLYESLGYEPVSAPVEGQPVTVRRGVRR